MRSRMTLSALLMIVAATTWHCAATNHRAHPPEMPLVAASTHTAEASSDFSFVIEFSETGMTARCERGCNWRELQFSCAPGVTPCRARISQRGVDGVPKQ